jgi:ketosteroid isomerase-like protein
LDLSTENLGGDVGAAPTGLERDTGDPMSQGNVQLVQRAQPSGVDMVQLFGGSTSTEPVAVGIDVTVFASDFEVEFIASQAARSIHPAPGPQGLAEGWRDWLEPWESYYIEAEDFIDAGDEVVSLVRVQARTTRDAVAVEHRPAAVWSVRDDKIVRIRFFLDRAQAFEAAGLGD